MADTKITALTALTAADPANDVIPIVDVSDTTMAASGTTKKISVNNILSSSPTASGALTVTGLVTAGSATITGDLTVDTSTLKVDSTNNRVGIGTATPQLTFVVSNAGTQGFEVNPSGSIISGGIDIISYNRSTSLYKGIGFGAESYLFRVGTASVSDAMTLNSTGLGVGGSPITSHFISAYGPLGITGTFAGTRTSYITNSSAASIYYTDGGGSGYFTDFGNLIIQPRTSAARSVVIATGSTTPVERAVVKSTGQVRFVPLAADPAGAESGDVYYNSVSNKLKCYNGTTWNDLF
jgi:hypothetical protein